MIEARRWLVVFVSMFAAWTPAQAEKRPNILLITVDTFRPDHLGAYGYERDTSPHLDSLSAEGVVFRQAYTTSGWTAPGLLSILTSLYAPAHGVDVRGRSMDPSITTLPEALRAAGYRAPDIFFLTDIPNFHHLGLGPYANRNRYLPDADEILFRWLEEEADRSDHPFFLYYHYRDLHQPYAPGPEYEDPYLRQAFGHPMNPLSWVRRFLAGEKLDLVRREIMLPRGVIDFASWDKGWVDGLYDGEIRRMDEGLFRRLRRVLRDRDLADNTIVVISADHGEELLEHGLIGHVSTFKEGRLVEEIVRIPLIFWAPGRLPAGVVVDEVVQCIDVLPTLLDMVRVSVPQGAQGRSLLPLVEGGSLPPRPAFFETSGGGYTADLEQYARRTRGLRAEGWKLLWRTPEDVVELYDLSTDPGEDREISDDRPAIADSLLQTLRSWVDDHPRVRSTPDAAGAPAVQAQAGMPSIAFPAAGDTLQYLGADQTIQLAWSGAPEAAYTIEYEVGEGAYYLQGVLEVTSSTPSYGPFHADFWNSLVLYNPWRFRVYPKGQPQAASGWVRFALASTGEGDLPWSAHLLAVAASGARLASEIQALGFGLVLGLADLLRWLSGFAAADVTAWVLLAAIAVALIWPRLQRYSEARIRAWAAVVLYVAVVYATIPVVPDVWRRLRDHAGEAAIAHLGTIAVLAMAASISWLVWRQSRGRRILLVPLAAVLGLYGWLLAAFGRFPAERLHLIEYGVMAFIVHRALRLHSGRPLDYALSLGLTSLIGFGDETIQWVLPQRYFELKDVGLNVAAGGLGLALTALASGRTTETAS